MDKQLARILKLTVTLLFFIIIFFILIVGRKFLYPLALSLLMSYLIFPIVSFLERKLKFPRFPAIFIPLILSIGLIVFIAKVFFMQVNVFIDDLPVISKQALDNVAVVQDYIAENFDFTIEQQQGWLKSQLSNFLDTSNKFFSKVIASTTDTVGRLFFIPIFTFFMLYYRHRAKKFILMLSRNDKNFSEKLLEQISKVTIKYMTGVLTVMMILAICHSVALSIIGVKYPIFLGIMAASISIIPYFGTLASTLIPLTFSLIFTTNPYEPMWIIIYYLIINSIENNILTPTITGGNVSLNPLITILGLILGAMVWGIPGMIIAIPALGVVKIVCDNVKGLEPYGYILGVSKPNKPLFSRKKKKKNSM